MAEQIQIFDVGTYKPKDTIVGPTFKVKMYYNPKTGETTLKTDSLIPQVIYNSKTNTWDRFVSPEDQKKLGDEKNNKLKALSANPNNKMPPSYTQNIAPTPPEGPPLGQAIEDLVKAATSNINIEEFDSKNFQKLFPSTKTLRYPMDLLENGGQDVLEITQFTYKSPYYEAIDKGNLTLENRVGQLGIQRRSSLRDKLATLYLPIPNNVSDSNSANWGSGDTMSNTNMAMLGSFPTVAAIAANSEVKKALDASGLSAILPIAAGAAGGPAASALLTTLLGSSDFVKNYPQLVLGMVNGSLANPTLRKNLERMVQQSIGYDVPVDTVLSRGYGVVSNSNLELLFAGPTLRQFSFGYVMSPRGRKEAEECRKIIRYFKQGMAPKKNQNVSAAYGYGQSSFLLGTPNVFKLSYKTKNTNTKKLENIKGLNRFKICALTGIQMNYADAAWAAYEEGQPVKMIMNLTFKELEPVYESDYQSEKGSFANTSPEDKPYLDADPVADGDIGY